MPTMLTEMKETLVANGLWPEEAEKVMEVVMRAEENEVMRDRWADSFSDYPPVIKTMAWMSAKQHAVEWLKANKPEHFALRCLEA